MDYQTLHGQDVTNFSQLQHRMPTVSAADALKVSQSSASRAISTGLLGLDLALQDTNISVIKAEDSCGGVSLGQITEIYGPPGVGKTSLGLELVTNSLLAGDHVVWIDTAHRLPGLRLLNRISGDYCQADETPHHPTASDLLCNLSHFAIPSLPHLIALICHTPSSFPLSRTSLIIIDSLSALVANAYHRTTDAKYTLGTGNSATPKLNQQTWAASRKWSLLQYLLSSLQKLAAVHNIAIVILNQTATKIRSGSNAILIPAISSTAWDTGIETKVMLFRDWGWDGKEVRFAKVIRANLVRVSEQKGLERIIAFTIHKHGVTEETVPEINSIRSSAIIATPSRPRKRKVDEIMDSEDDDLEGSDEDYGWAEEDEEELPDPPPQWQGSEDILVLGQDEVEEDDSDTNEENEGI